MIGQQHLLLPDRTSGGAYPDEKTLSNLARQVARLTKSDHCSIFLADAAGRITLRGSTSPFLKDQIEKMHYTISEPGGERESLTVRAFIGGPSPIANSADRLSAMKFKVPTTPAPFMAAAIRGPSATYGVVRVVREDTSAPYVGAQMITLRRAGEQIAEFLAGFADFKRLSNTDERIYRIERPNLSLVQTINHGVLERLSRNPSELYELSSRAFEELIAELLEKDGWQTELSLPTRDGGYDIRAVRRIGGIDFSVLVEAKRFRRDRAVGVGVLRELYAVKQRKHASKALLATTSYLSSPAQIEFDDVIPWEIEVKGYSELVEWLRRSQSD